MGLPIVGGSDGSWGTTLNNFLGGAGGDGTPTIPNNRIPYLASGNHTSSANLTFDGTTLTIPAAVVTASAALTITPAAGTGLNVVLSTTGDLAVNTNQLYVDTSTGFVGFGTTTPARIVEIWESVASNTPGLRLTNNHTDGWENQLEFFTGADTGYASGQVASSGAGATSNLRLKVTNASKAMTIYLQIIQTGIVSMPAYGAGTATFDSGGVISSVSDERLKNILGPFTAGLAELLHIDPILFNWNQDSGMDRENVYTGFSAQNVMKWIPEAVGKGPSGMYSLDDRVLLAALVNSVKSLYQEVVELRTKTGLTPKAYRAMEVLDEKRLIKSRRDVE